jgi:hypothetical protein
MIRLNRRAVDSAHEEEERAFDAVVDRFDEADVPGHLRSVRRDRPEALLDALLEIEAPARALVQELGHPRELLFDSPKAFVQVVNHSRPLSQPRFFF